MCNDGSSLLVEMFYSADATCTVISPTDVVIKHEEFDSWWQVSNVHDGSGHLRFYSSSGLNHITVPLIMKNNLWFVEQDVARSLYRASVQNATSAFISAVDGSTLHHLWHHRLGHQGTTITTQVSKVCDGVPNLTVKNPFHYCDDCSRGKMTSMIKGHDHSEHVATSFGERFQMDFGFVRGTYKKEGATAGPLVTSIDDCTAYLLIIDESDKIMWVFTTRGKNPPIEIVDDFLSKYGLSSGNRYVRTDRGGELARSHAFQELIRKHKYVLETTAPGSSFQNGTVERGHRTLANMMRSMLRGAGLGPEYWTYALRHAVYLRNRLPHTALPDMITPFEKYHSRRPDLHHLRVFGSLVTVKNPGDRPTKIDDKDVHTSSGVFLGFTATDRNIIFEDCITKKIKIARHAVFDEAHYSKDFRPPYAQQLIDLAESNLVNKSITKSISTPKSTPPRNTPAASSSNTPSTSSKFSRPPLSPTQIHTLPTTTSPPRPSIPTPSPQHHSAYLQKHVHIIPPDDHAAVYTISNPLSDIEFTGCPHGPTQSVIIPTSGSHPTLGLDLYRHKDNDRIMLRQCLPSTPAAKIRKWRSTLRHATILALDDIVPNSINDITDYIDTCRTKKQQQITITFIPMESTTSNAATGVPQVNFDQLVIMSHQHTAARNNTEPWSKPLETPPITEAMIHSAVAQGHLRPRLTRAYLKKQSDWMDWQLSEYSQLNSYHSQNMFSTPIPRPPNCNVLPLIWTYTIKPNGVKKARCVCNGSPRQKGTVTLDHTYAAALEQSGARLFWSLASVTNSVVIGADATNAFAEAPAPKAPLYVTIDEPFRHWWVHVMKRPPITPGHVLPVNHALQGHPESPRLWAKLIHTILTKMHFKSCAHEPCLYVHKYSKTPVYFLRQVDDFAVAAHSKEYAQTFLNDIQKHLTQPMKDLGVITMFNGLDITQSRSFIKVSCSTYIKKILRTHNWDTPSRTSALKTPLPSDKTFIRNLESTKGPSDPLESKQLSQTMQFSYRQAIGELLFAAITCRPDILFAVIKLSQYSTRPAKIHYQAAKYVFKYLRDTIDDGLHYWRPQQRMDLPEAPFPTLPKDTHHLQIPRQPSKTAYGCVDADWGGRHLTPSFRIRYCSISWWCPSGLSFQIPTHCLPQFHRE